MIIFYLEIEILNNNNNNDTVRLFKKSFIRQTT